MTSDNKDSQLDYKKSGVDVDAGYELVKRIKPYVKKTKRPEILSGLGSFSAISRIPSHIKNPLLVTCTDGVGTKIEIAKSENKFEKVHLGISCERCHGPGELHVAEKMNRSLVW